MTNSSNHFLNPADMMWPPISLPAPELLTFGTTLPAAFTPYHFHTKVRTIDPKGLGVSFHAYRSLSPNMCETVYVVFLGFFIVLRIFAIHAFRRVAFGVAPIQPVGEHIPRR